MPSASQDLQDAANAKLAEALPLFEKISTWFDTDVIESNWAESPEVTAEVAEKLTSAENRQLMGMIALVNEVWEQFWEVLEEAKRR